MARPRSKEQWVKEGENAILNLLAEEHACTWDEIEAKLAHTPWTTHQRLDPHILTNAKKNLLASGQIHDIQGRSKGGRIVPTLQLADTLLRQTKPTPKRPAREPSAADTSHGAPAETNTPNESAAPAKWPPTRLSSKQAKKTATSSPSTKTRRPTSSAISSATTSTQLGHLTMPHGSLPSTPNTDPYLRYSFQPKSKTDATGCTQPDHNSTKSSTKQPGSQRKNPKPKSSLS